MRHNSPFKFLDSYQKGDLDVFFGREKETERLYEALNGVKLLMVYGPSGAGKTSLIECGLRNQFSDADWLAITVRRDGDINASVLARIRKQIHESFNLTTNAQLPVESDSEFGHAVERLFAEQYKPVYLLFDQFEELLMQGNDVEKQVFFSNLDRLVHYKIPCRVLLIMREEFIGHLSEFEPLCPGIFQHRFRLEKMNRLNVRQVIENMLGAPRYRQSFSVSNSEQLIDSILARLPDERKEIELAHVQVFLSELWDRAAQSDIIKERVTLHAGLVQSGDNLAGVLESFLKKQLAELTPVHGENAPMELLAAMISERYTKLQLDIGEMEAHFAKNSIHLAKPLSELLHNLEQRRILRTLKASEQTRYEISHDVLARVVGQNLTEEMKLREKAREIYRVYEGRIGYFSREDLDYLRPFEAYLAVPDTLEKRMRESEAELGQRERDDLDKAQKQAETERSLREKAEQNEKRSRQRTKLAATVSIIALLLATVSGWLYLRTNKALIAEEKATREAKEAAESEKQAKELVIQQKRTSDSLRVVAKNSTDIATIEKSRAVSANEQARLEQIKSAKIQGKDLRNENQYDAARQIYTYALRLAMPSEQPEIIALIDICDKERQEHNYQENRKIGLGIAKTGQCKAAEKFLLEAYRIKPNDPQIVEAMKLCKINF